MFVVIPIIYLYLCIRSKATFRYFDLIYFQKDTEGMKQRYLFNGNYPIFKMLLLCFARGKTCDLNHGISKPVA